MAKCQMFKAIKRLIKKEYQMEIGPNTKIKDLDMDSLDTLELVMRIEDVLDINIPMNVVSEDLTIQELIALKA